MHRTTSIDIQESDFLIDGTVTFPGREFRGHRIEGLLPNSRMIQGIFDDLNPETRARWDYPDGPWDPDRNTEAFVAAMPEWRAHGLLAFTVGLQGGSPEGYSEAQPWRNSAFEADGSLRPDYVDRLRRILDEADRLGMGVIASLFYFGQDHRLANEQAVRGAISNAVNWLADSGYRNVLIEIANEIDCPRYTHPCLAPERVHELIELAQTESAGKVDNRIGRSYVGTSYLGGRLPSEAVVETSDLILLHGNGVRQPATLREMVRSVRAMPSYRNQPIVFNEDDHFDFERAENHFIAATSEHASWGFFDYRMRDETDFSEGYQSMPCDWGIRSERKRGFFGLLREMTGAKAKP